MPADSPELTDLTDLDRQILEFERDWVAHVGAKDAVLRERFDLTPTRYHQLLNRLIDLPAAEVHAPRLVRRLRRLRAARHEQRSARRTRQP
ncbi:MULTISPECIES: DUF3263 domain-containing protein [unclassified Nocardioides]|uniref:DUF3263 domain-containing protein n=1 Tax=unclassified Nocardioides TaxID=2615069 RepID=UPI0000571525|nr:MULTISPECIES: DUF3263 domain-containing protein [unclassified Nocardioides]ABL80400.1 conserved hypothetical protein [Nocardioides sp. JS614]MBI2246258.1 DUF3263 domain-containing protein [Nocardioides sp.]